MVKLPELMNVDQDVQMASIGTQVDDWLSIFIDSIDVKIAIEQKKGTCGTVEKSGKMKKCKVRLVFLCKRILSLKSERMQQQKFIY
jgi:hypothetical protein